MLDGPIINLRIVDDSNGSYRGLTATPHPIFHRITHDKIMGLLHNVHFTLWLPTI